MPCLNVQGQNITDLGPILQVAVGVSAPIAKILTEQKQTIPKPVLVIALIDTGASKTVIQDGIAKQLSLTARGVAQINTPSCNSYQCETYDISLSFVGFNVSIPLISVIEAPLSGQNISCLIGRDILKSGVFIYQGFTNSFTLSF